MPFVTRTPDEQRMFELCCELCERCTEAMDNLDNEAVRDLSMILFSKDDEQVKELTALLAKTA